MRLFRHPAVLALAPGAVMLAVLVWWAADDGGYAPGVWLPGGLAVLGAGLVVAAGRPIALGRLGTAGRLAAGAIVAYAAWSALSILWADSAGVAYEGALRTAVFAACFLLALALPWTPSAALGAASLHVLAVIGLGLVALVLAARVGAADVDRFFLSGRLAWPLDYYNADAALWTMAAVPALVLGAHPRVPALVRPLLLAGAALLLDLALIGQSRGWLVSLPVVAVVTLALVPHRLRVAGFALPVIGAVAAAAGPGLHVYEVSGQGAPAQYAAVADAMGAAGDRIAWTCLALLVVAAALVAADRRAGLAERRFQISRRVTAGLVAGLVAAGLAAGWAATGGHPAERVRHGWDDFKANRMERSGQSRLLAVGSSRYEFWRVAVNQAGAHPLAGLGQDNYAQAYLRERRNADEEPRWTHSLELRLLVHTGVVGLALFLLFIGAALVAALRARTLAGALLVLPATIWVVHGTVDWLWEYPALSGTALAWLGIAVALGRAPPRPKRPADGPSERLAALGPARPAAVAVVVVALLLGTAFVGDRLTTRAARNWPADPRRALRDLRTAGRLQPLSARPALVAGLIAMRAGDVTRARGELARAIERDPHDWFARFLDGLAATSRRDRAAARRRFGEARDADPREPVIAIALRRLPTAHPLDLAGATAILQRRLDKRFGPRRARGL